MLLMLMVMVVEPVSLIEGDAHVRLDLGHRLSQYQARLVIVSPEKKTWLWSFLSYLPRLSFSPKLCFSHSHFIAKDFLFTLQEQAYSRIKQLVVRLVGCLSPCENGLTNTQENGY